MCSHPDVNRQYKRGVTRLGGLSSHPSIFPPTSASHWPSSLRSLSLWDPGAEAFLLWRWAVCDTPLGTFPASYSGCYWALTLDLSPACTLSHWAAPHAAPSVWYVPVIVSSLAHQTPHPVHPSPPPILRSQLSLSQRVSCLTLLHLRQCLFICMFGQQLWKTGSAVSAKPRGPCRKPLSNRWMNVIPSPCQDGRVP